MGFVAFMSSMAGRVTRAVAGVALVVVGAVLGGGWLVLALVGLVFIAVGVFDVCLLAPLFKQPFSGKAVRAKLK
ncbi:YgaP-like transmembrane domain [Demequina lutea]|uniref:Fatty acid desaturase n=1 Tax=Demequina lutea TaxID=431489 RepID=A0A7Y9ZBF9_9MICO|nr:YgaP-like transmembrane domain [Demequina lutea]NYI41508.1 fatty acid desaturase [Demequina lutea]